VQTTEVRQLVTRAHCRVQAALLRHVAPSLTIQRSDPVTIPLQIATIGLQDAEQDAQQRGFAGPVGSEQTGEDAGFDIDGDAVQGCPVPESMTDCGDLKHRAAVRATRPVFGCPDSAQGAVAHDSCTSVLASEGGRHLGTTRIAILVTALFALLSR
jgi:hypothetical protein